MDAVLAWLTTPVGVVAVGISGGVVGAVGAAFGVLAFVSPPREPTKKLQWAPCELTTAIQGGGIATTNLVIWNGGPTLHGNEFATLAPLELVASAGAVLDHIAVASVKNPANDVKVRRRTDRMRRARIDFEYLNHGDGFVLTVRHTGGVPQIKGEIVGAAGPERSALQLARSAMHMFSVLMHGRRHAKRELWLRRLSSLSMLVMMPLAPFALSLQWDWRIQVGYE